MKSLDLSDYKTILDRQYQMKRYKLNQKFELILNVLHKSRPNTVQCGPDFIRYFGLPYPYYTVDVLYDLLYGPNNTC